MKDIEKILMHPIRMRMIQLIAQQKATTVAALAGAMADVPRSTIYHHIAILLENQILQVMKEHRVRGTYEREYGLNYDRIAIPTEKLESTVSNLLFKLYADFCSYFARPHPDPLRDQLFLSVNTLMLSDEEFETCKTELFRIVQKYCNLPAQPNRSARSLTVISSPSVEEQTTDTSKEDPS